MDIETALPSVRCKAIDTAIQRARDALNQADEMLAAPAGEIASTPIAREALAKALLKGRRKRADIIRDVDFGEPAWDMLIELYVARAEGRARRDRRLPRERRPDDDGAATSRKAGDDRLRRAGGPSARPAAV